MSLALSLLTFASTRPSLDFANYGDTRLYRAESRGITRDLHAVRELQAIARYLCTDSEILESARGGRVEITSHSDDNGSAYRVAYCASQYYPVEYRAAVARVLASAIWKAWAREIGNRPDTCTQIRRRALFELSPSVYRRFFA